MTEKTPLAHATNWRKSSRSKQQGECVEIGSVPGVVGIRDTKDRHGGTLAVTATTFGSFLNSLKSGQFDQ